MKIAKIRDVKTPVRGTEKSGGIDFFVPNDHQTMVVMPGGGALIPSGLKIKIPEGFALVALNKSGIALNHTVIVGASLVDEDYQGEVHIHVINVGTKPFTISAGMKLVQFSLIKMHYFNIDVVDEKDLFDEVTNRGAGGFGSTGIN